MSLSDIGRRIRKRMVYRMNDAMTFLVATAWTLLFDDIFMMITGDDPSLFARVMHAVSFTFIVVLISVAFDSEETED